MSAAEIALSLVFLAVFVSMWAMITITLATQSGWRELAGLYPDRKEAPLLVVRGQSGSLGAADAAGSGLFSFMSPFRSVSYGGCLDLAACPSGLRVSIWWIFGPAERPFLVPWNEIEPGEREIFFSRYTALRFTRSNRRLTLSPRTWRRLAARRPGQGEAAIDEADRGAALHHLKAWAVATAFLGTFFSFALASARPPFPLGMGYMVAGLLTAIPNLLGYIGEKLSTRRR